VVSLAFKSTFHGHHICLNETALITIGNSKNKCGYKDKFNKYKLNLSIVPIQNGNTSAFDKDVLDTHPW
jgi:hypothetical protein